MECIKIRKIPFFLSECNNLWLNNSAAYHNNPEGLNPKQSLLWKPQICPSSVYFCDQEAGVSIPSQLLHDLIPVSFPFHAFAVIMTGLLLFCSPQEMQVHGLLAYWLIVFKCYVTEN